ncbi:MAG: RHS repeat-associated core domain-containing protein, partial [Blastocatellia bacterium]|nr:RHS repeat-associated core domain-containing protein [Blastocatellia bacterium]
LIESPEGSYQYDAENRMVRATVNSKTTSFQYDGEGRRIRKSSELENRVYIYAMDGSLIAEYEASSTSASLKKEYIYGESGLVATVEVEAGAVEKIDYITSDHLSSPRLITSQNAEVVSRRDFYPFGGQISSTVGGRAAIEGYSTTDSLRHKFTTYERDDETGLDFAQARYYGSLAGRFISPDPVTLTYTRMFDPQQFNLYTYTRNSPLILTDPTGLDFQFVGKDGDKFVDDFNSRDKAQFKVKLN